MGNLLLNSQSVIMCPHGGMVSHIPTTYTSYRVDGRRPMFLTDHYVVVGCPNYMHGPSPCTMVTWLNGTVLLLVKGQPLLTLSSVGLCQSASGIMQGPAIITYTQTGQREPDTFTSIND